MLEYCEWCSPSHVQNRWQATGVKAGRSVCDTCASKMHRYCVCRHCGAALSADKTDSNLKNFVESACDSDVCKLREAILTGQICCSKAKIIPCVCTRSYECPDHGTTHVGTHD